MKIIRHDDPAARRAFQALRRVYVPREDVKETVASILADVVRRGDRAVADYTAKFGGPRLSPSRFRVSEDEIDSALRSTPTSTRRAIRASITNVATFAKKSLRKNWTARNAQGTLVGERFDPYQRVGIYVPGGTAPLVSTAVMTCTLARAARVPQIVAVTPAAKDGSVNPALLTALHLSGATEIYRIGGAQAIAALAYGTRTIQPVVKIFGPGNAYVVEAKRQVFGRVAVDLLPGPSEIFIIADSSANPAWVAADLLAQAEHGEGSISILATNSAAFAEKVRAEIEKQSATLSRTEALRASLRHALIVIVRNLNDAVQLANDFAPEHLAIATRNPEALAALATTSGAIFLGHMSPVAGGDFLAGPSHELPTGGAGHSFPGLTVDQFQRRTSIVRFDAASLRRSLPTLETFSAIEGLDAHGLSARIRLA